MGNKVFIKFCCSAILIFSIIIFFYIIISFKISSAQEDLFISCDNQSGYYITGTPVYCFQQTRISLKSIVKIFEKGFNAIFRPIREVGEWIGRQVAKTIEEAIIWLAGVFGGAATKEQVEMIIKFIFSDKFCNYIAQKLPKDYSKLPILIKQKFGITLNNPDNAGGDKLVVDFDTFKSSWENYPEGPEKGEEIRKRLKDYTPQILAELNSLLGPPYKNNKVYVIYVPDFEKSDFNEYGTFETGGHYREDFNIIFISGMEINYELTKLFIHELAHAFNDGIIPLEPYNEGIASAAEHVVFSKLFKKDNLEIKPVKFPGTLSLVYSFRTSPGLAPERYKQSAFVFLKILEKDKEFIKKFRKNIKSFSDFYQVYENPLSYVSRLIMLGACDTLTSRDETKPLLIHERINELWNIFVNSYSGNLITDIGWKNLEVFMVEDSSRLVNEVNFERISDNLIKLEGRALYKEGSFAEIITKFAAIRYNLNQEIINGWDLLNKITKENFNELGPDLIEFIQTKIMPLLEIPANNPIKIEILEWNQQLQDLITSPPSPTLSPTIIKGKILSSIKLKETYSSQFPPYTYVEYIDIVPGNVYNVWIQPSHKAFYSTIYKACYEIPIINHEFRNCLPEKIVKKPHEAKYIDAFSLAVNPEFNELIVYRGIIYPPTLSILDKNISQGKLNLKLKINNGLRKNILSLKLLNLTGRTLLEESRSVSIRNEGPVVDWVVNLPSTLSPGVYNLVLEIKNELFTRPVRTMTTVRIDKINKITIKPTYPPRGFIELSPQSWQNIATWEFTIDSSKEIKIYKLLLESNSMTSPYWPFSKIKINFEDKTNLLFTVEKTLTSQEINSKILVFESINKSLQPGNYILKVQGFTLPLQDLNYPYKGGTYNFSIKKIEGFIDSIIITSEGEAYSPNFMFSIYYYPNLQIKPIVMIDEFPILIYRNKNNRAELYFASMNRSKNKIYIKLFDKTNKEIKVIEVKCDKRCSENYNDLLKSLGEPEKWAIPLVKWDWNSTVQYTFDFILKKDNYRCETRITNNPSYPTNNLLKICSGFPYFAKILDVNFAINWVYIPYQERYVYKMNYTYTLPPYYYQAKKLYPQILNLLANLIGILFKLNISIR